MPEEKGAIRLIAPRPILKMNFINAVRMVRKGVGIHRKKGGIVYQIQIDKDGCVSIWSEEFDDCCVDVKDILSEEWVRS